MAAYEFVPGMREISGFGGGYEAACRAMVKAGCEWFDQHPDAAPVFKGFKNVTGICLDENEDAKALTKAIIDAADGDATGAMHQAAVSHVMFIKRSGWDAYVAAMSKAEDAA